MSSDDRAAGLLSGALDAGDGPARPLAAGEAEAMVAAIVDRLAPPTVSVAAASSARAGWAAAGGLLVGFVLAGTMAAAIVLGMRASPTPTPEEPRDSVPAVVPAAPEPPRREPPPARSIEPTPEPSAVPIETPRAAPRPAVDRLAEANAHRRARDYAAAALVYGQVARGRGPAAYAAAVAAGELELEHLGRPDRAVAHFERAIALEPDGALALSALEGLAQSARRAGRPSVERRALRALIERHPGTRAAARALEREEEISR